MRTYLAYPIDLATGADRLHVQTTLAHIRGVVKGRDILIYDPGAAFINTEHAMIGPEVRQINMAALDLFDNLLVLYPKGSKSWGVPQEIERALSQGKIVILVTDQDPTWSMAWDRAGGGMLIIADPNLYIGGWSGAAAQGLEYLYEDSRGISEPLGPGMRHIDGGAGPSEAPEYLPVRLLDVPQPSVISLIEGGFNEPPGGIPIIKGRMPTRTYPDDAGLDLYVVGDWEIGPGQFVDIRCGVQVELPEWAWGFLVGRSSTLRTRGLMVNPAIIDTGYRGELFSGVFNPTGEIVKISDGERIAQLILIENGTRRVEPVEVSAIREHSRGANGFGSSGA